jgi:hypothetical protein
MRIAIVLALGNASAADAPIAQPRVDVNAVRDPAEKSYRRIVRGMDLYERRHALAPNASLRFKLLPRNRDTSMEEIALGIVGDTVRIPVPVAADNTFALERSGPALDEDASVVPNRRARTMTWRTDIRTPGLPPNTRRLGDLRLECLVGIEADLVSNPRSIVAQIARLATDHGYCDQQVPEYLFFAERPLWSVTLVHGSRRETLPVAQMYAGSSRSPMTKADLEYCDCEVLVDRTYYAPLGDSRWPDDTLLEFEYMDDVIPPAAGDSKADVIAARGAARAAVRFDTGFEVWTYRVATEGAGRQGLAELLAGVLSLEDGQATSPEFVILFAPSGFVAKTRVRPASVPQRTDRAASPP